LGVLHVPDIGTNLITVPSIVDKGFQVEFTKSACIVSKLDTGKVIGKQQGNIYSLSGLQEVAYAGQSRRKDYITKEM